MPETGLTIDYTELQKRVSFLACGTRDLTRISKEDRELVDSLIESGLRRFYYPKQAGGVLYDWSFLRPQFRLLVNVGTNDYTMPAQFAGIEGNLVHDKVDNMRLPVTKVSVDEINRLRGLNLQVASWPIHFAERAVESGGRTPTRWQVLIWPDPSATYILYGTYRVHPLAPNGAAQPFLYGGPEHGETIIEACLAATELHVDGMPGAHAQAFDECLQSSIAMDAVLHQPELLGYNGDHRYQRNDPLMRDSMHFENFSPVTYGGVDYSG